MNFDFTDDQQAIKRTARDFLADRLKHERWRELAESGTYDEGVWGEMAELGWPGIHLGEDSGARVSARSSWPSSWRSSATPSRPHRSSPPRRQAS